MYTPFALYRNQEIRELEALAMQQAGCDALVLMETAGKAAFEAMRQHWPLAERIVVCCGKGNNGGDGFVLARLARELGLAVEVFTVVPPDQLASTARQAAERAEAAGVTCQPYDANTVFRADIIVDALLGSGLKGDVQAPYVEIVEAINASPCPVLAMDVPSGIDVDTGNVQGCCVQAALTMTFIGYKQGLLTHKAPAFCGKLLAHDLNIPKDLFDQVSHSAEIMQWQALKPLLPHRQRDAHKGHYGHVLVVGGDYGMGGAVRMAAEAAMRVGAGLVTVATRPEHVSVVNCSRPEIMCHQVNNGEDLQALIDKASVIVIGPGLGKSEWAEMLLAQALQSDLPKVLDADSLNILSTKKQYSDNWILTPHPGEAARLLDCSTQALQEDRYQSANAIQQQYGGLVVLKGAGTIVKAEGLPQVCQAGNPGMATGGMGDILSGVVGGLLAQGMSMQKAAEAGVMAHSLAADRAADEGGERGLLATDLMPHLRELVNPESL